MYAEKRKEIKKNNTVSVFIKKQEMSTVDTSNINVKQFIPFPFTTINNKKYREDNNNMTTLYLYLCSKIVRKPMADNLNLYKKYYYNNYLACSITHNKLAEAFGHSNTRTIKRWINALERLEYIKIDKVKIPGQQKRNVYILGKHENNNSCFFIEELYK